MIPRRFAAFALAVCAFAALLSLASPSRRRRRRAMRRMADRYTRDIARFSPGIDPVIAAMLPPEGWDVVGGRAVITATGYDRLASALGIVVEVEMPGDGQARAPEAYRVVARAYHRVGERTEAREARTVGELPLAARRARSAAIAHLVALLAQPDR